MVVVGGSNEDVVRVESRFRVTDVTDKAIPAVVILSFRMSFSS
jgi:hypothetical protein